MKSILCLTFASALLAADPTPPAIERMMDPSLNVAQRNNACFELRGAATPEVIHAMRTALNDPKVRACAGKNLRQAGAVEELKGALADQDAEVRSIAARELGAIEEPELLPLLTAAAGDSELIVASNAVEGLANYRDPAVVPFLLEIAKRGGLIGTASLSRALPFHDVRTLTVVRTLLDSKDVSDKLAAMRALGEIGETSDVAKLREIAQKETEMVSASSRGFGLMPAISLSRAAQTAIGQIESREKVTSVNFPEPR